MPALFSNRLIHETSPYLLQHAHNPVDWYPWGDEALQKAKDEQKIILVSIGYAACHWCHVMEKESFEHEDVAALMNADFINIKIDREERPDLDHIYMDAVQAMTGSGGWPLNVFLTPSAKPFYGGTYFPPVKAYNRSSWTEVLDGVNRAWQQKKDEVLQQADKLTEHLEQANDFGKLVQGTDADAADMVFTKAQADSMFQQIMKSADREWGGFGKAPKFPQTFTIGYLLQYYHFTGDAEARRQALLSIDKMLEGGIYDHVGGGLARYSTDTEWLAPHFEKMLYDNALLINVLADAYLVTNDPSYEIAIRKTIGFAERELMDAGGGFYAALDADSEGEEGRYYVWQKPEVDELLGDDSTLFCAYFDITDAGNWEGKNILRILKKPGVFAAEMGLSQEVFERKMTSALALLLSKRNGRVHPQLDDKLILSWNALMITALCKAAAALNDKHYRQLAEKHFEFLFNHLKKAGEGIGFYHTYKQGVAKYPAFLDDYAFLIQACIRLQELTSDTSYLYHAKQLTEHVIAHFGDEDTGYFFFTHKGQEDVIIRKKEVYDGAIASGNSVMAENLEYLSVVFNDQAWRRLAQKITWALQPAVIKYPTSFAVWASHLLRQLYGLHEIVITGPEADEFRDRLSGHYVPNKILQCSVLPNRDFPLFEGREFGSSTLVYLCSNYSCRAPVQTLEALLLLIGENS